MEHEQIHIYQNPDPNTFVQFPARLQERDGLYREKKTKVSEHSKYPMGARWTRTWAWSEEDEKPEELTAAVFVLMSDARDRNPNLNFSIDAIDEAKGSRSG